MFLVADTLHEALSIRPSVGPSVRQHISKSGEMSVLEAFWAAALEEAMTYDSI